MQATRSGAAKGWHSLAHAEEVRVLAHALEGRPVSIQEVCHLGIAVRHILFLSLVVPPLWIMSNQDTTNLMGKKPMGEGRELARSTLQRLATISVQHHLRWSYTSDYITVSCAMGSA